MIVIDRSRVALNRLIAAAAAIMLSGCASTSLVDMWRDPNYPRQPINNVLVVSIRRDRNGRRIWEDGFVAALKARGISATPSYTEFPDEAPDTAALTSAVKGKGYDGVLVSHQLPGTTDTHYVPGYIAAEPSGYISPWTGHYYLYYSQVYSPGYVETDRVVRYETELYLTRSQDRLVWTGTTESINPTSAQQVNAEIADVIVPQLAKSGTVQTH